MYLKSYLNWVKTIQRTAANRSTDSGIRGVSQVLSKQQPIGALTLESKMYLKSYLKWVKTIQWTAANRRTDNGIRSVSQVLSKPRKTRFCSFVDKYTTANGSAENGSTGGISGSLQFSTVARVCVLVSFDRVWMSLSLQGACPCSLRALRTCTPSRKWPAARATPWPSPSPATRRAPSPIRSSPSRRRTVPHSAFRRNRNGTKKNKQKLGTTPSSLFWLSCSSLTPQSRMIWLFCRQVSPRPVQLVSFFSSHSSVQYKSSSTRWFQTF